MCKLHNVVHTQNINATMIAKGQEDMRDTILFDLDGTLLPMVTEDFLFEYFVALGQHLEDHIDPKELPEIMIEATAVTMNNTQPLTNETVFIKKFMEMVGGDPTFYLHQFRVFYETKFEVAKRATWQNQDILKSVQILKDKGYNLVIATNPLFPMKANLQRIEWAGLDPKDFCYITSLEENCYCKPNLEFFQEVLDKIDKFPDECMMVGNDVHEDNIARYLGIKTYLITDCKVTSEHEEPITPNYQGTYHDFLEFVEGLDRII